MKRWHNHLNPNIKKEPWSKEEEKIVLNAHESMVSTLDTIEQDNVTHYFFVFTRVINGQKLLNYFRVVQTILSKTTGILV